MAAFHRGAGNSARNAETMKTAPRQAQKNPSTQTGVVFQLKQLPNRQCCSAGAPGTPEPALSLTLRLPAYPTYRVCELVGNELAHQGNGCGPFLPNLEE